MEPIFNESISPNLTPQAIKEDLVTQDVNGETLVYNLKQNQAFCLNPTSAAVWQLCNGAKTINQIHTGLSKQFKNEVSEELVWLALSQLKEKNLITFGENVTSKQIEFVELGNLPRRTLIKRAALTAVIALPVVTSLVIPSAASAQSVVRLADGATCQQDAQCQSDCCLSNLCEPAAACQAFRRNNLKLSDFRENPKINSRIKSK